MSVEGDRPSAIETMRRRVEASLAYRLQMSTLKSRELLDYNLDELPLFVSIGALTEPEAEAWRERFTSVAEALRAPDSEVVSEEQRSRARELFEEALADYEASGRDSDELPFWRVQALLRTFKAVGAASDEEAIEWDRRFHDVLEQRSKAKREARPKPEGAGEKPVGEGKRFEARELRSVRLGPPERLNGVRVTCAELYEDCVIVRWHRLLSAEELQRGASSSSSSSSTQPTPDEVAAHFGATFSLDDDLGTPYEPAARADEITGDKTTEKRIPEGDEPIPVWGRSVLVPSAPSEAKALTARNGEAEFSLQWAL